MREHRAGQSGVRHRTDGTILIVTIWVVLVLAGLALVFARSIRVAVAVSANHVASLQAECISAGALEWVRAMLITSAEEQETLPEELHETESEITEEIEDVSLPIESDSDQDIQNE